MQEGGRGEGRRELEGREGEGEGMVGERKEGGRERGRKGGRCLDGRGDGGEWRLHGMEIAQINGGWKKRERWRLIDFT